VSGALVQIGLGVLRGILMLGLLAAPLVADAQPGKAFRVGFLTAFSSNADAPLFDSFRQAMRDLRYEEGRNIAYQTRWAEGSLERLPGLAAELVSLKLDVMLAASTPAETARPASLARRASGISRRSYFRGSGATRGGRGSITQSGGLPGGDSRHQ
jgi:putative ABC transport system substrate-binding protein